MALPSWLAATVHLGVDCQCGAACSDDFALEGHDVASENRELEVDAVKHQQDSVFGVNILSYSKIRALQKIFRAAACEKSLVMVQVGEFYQSLRKCCFHFLKKFDAKIRFFSCFFSKN